MKHLIAWLVVASVLSITTVVVGAKPAGACSCVGVDDAQAFAQADAVFVGEVVGYEPPAQSTSSIAPALWTFNVQQVYKGAVARNQVVVSEVSGASCGLEIAKSGEFLVFGSTLSFGSRPVPGAGQLYAGLCGGTRALSAGALQPDLANPRTFADRSYPLPTDGWKPGGGGIVMDALTGGEFHAVLTPEGACAWLGSGTSAYLWPVGYRVRFDPTRLLDARGRVIAKEDDVLKFGGGALKPPTGTRCVAPGQEAWHVQSRPLPR